MKDMAKKKKNRYGNPQKNIEAQRAREQKSSAKTTGSADVEAQIKAAEKAYKPSAVTEKSMLLRIFVIAIAAVMVLGFVVGAVLNF